MPESSINEFGKFITAHDWGEVLGTDMVNKKAENFHITLRSKLDQYFPEKLVKISSLDKKWMNPSLKLLHRKVQREFFKHRQSQKWRRLKGKFKRAKRKAIQNFYSKFVNDLKQSNLGNWY